MAEQGAKKWFITITVILAAMLELVDTTVVNVSLPQIMGNLGATLNDVAWVITAYGIANVIIIPMTSWLSSKFGRRQYFIFSILLFTAASFFCGNATNIWELILFRFIQGLGGGGLLSTSQAILMETWPKEELGMAMALFGLGVVFAPTFGPTLGGWITDNYSWPWVFFINLPLGLFAAWMAFTFIGESKYRQIIDYNDWWGIILLVVWVGSLQVVLERGEAEDWFDTGYITLLTFTAVVGFALFVWRELSIEHPVVNLRVMKSTSLSLGMFFTFILGFGLFGSVFLFPVFCQNILGFTANQTGTLMIPGGMIMIVCMPVIGTLIRKGVNPKILAGLGFTIFFLYNYTLMHYNADSSHNDFFFPLILRSVGMSLLFVPLTTISLSSIPPHEIAQGTAMNNMMRQLGGAFGIALMSTVLTNRIGFHSARLGDNFNNYNTAFTSQFNSAVANFMSKGYSLEAAQNLAYKFLDGRMMKQASVLAYSDVYLVVGGFMLICIPLILLLKYKPQGK
ncbi:MAG: DHA2 family efflux MFS transporter permease subunit, partial [Pseudomonadota bacterium]